MSDRSNDWRDVAVRVVDARHGYTAEFAPDPVAHRAEYDDEERRLTPIPGVKPRGLAPRPKATEDGR